MIEHGDDGRTIEITIGIEADPERVWQAIIQPEEIERWFPLKARGDARDGGVIEVTWGDEGWWGSTLTIPENGAHARFVDESAAADGGAVMYMDYHLESDRGSTIVRFVHSGFGPDDKWDDYLDALDAGWSYFLRNLKVYLEHHAGTPRTMIHARHGTRGTRREILATLATAVGIDLQEMSDREMGETLPILIDDERVESVLEAYAPGRTLAARLPSLNQSLLFMEIEKAGDEAKVGVWFSTYDAGESIERRLHRTLGSIVAALDARRLRISHSALSDPDRAAGEAS